MKKTPFISRNFGNLALMAALVIAAAMVFYLELTLVPTGPNDEKLFGALEFFLSIAIGWTAQSIVGKEEFQRSLKQYGLSAYRRISDIRRSVVRISSTIERARQPSQSQRSADLQVLQAIAAELADTVSSSMDDWVDIIGEDLDKLKRIEELREQLRLGATRGTQSTERISRDEAAQLRHEIESLRADLPYLLKAPAFPGEDSFPREGRHSDVAASLLRSMAAEDGTLSLPVNYMGDFDNTTARHLRAQRPFSLSVDQVMFQMHLGLHDKRGNLIGELLNPLEGAGVYHNDFVVTLFGFLPPEPVPTPDIEGARIPLPQVQIIPASAREFADFYIKIPANPAPPE